jgi:hypothetical protein
MHKQNSKFNKNLKLTVVKNSVRLLFILLFLVKYASAVPLDIYRERIDKAVSELEAITAVSKDEGEEELIRTISSALSFVRSTLPEKETVEYKGKKIEVDNSWLGPALERYEKEPLDTARNSEELLRIIGRLNALSEQITELEQAKEVTNKDSDKDRLRIILARHRQIEIDEQNKPMARLQKKVYEVLNAILEWLSSLFPDRPGRVGSAGSNTGSFIGRIIIYSLTLALLIFLLWKLVPILFRLRRIKSKEPKRKTMVIMGEHVDADKTPTDLLKEAETLAMSGDPRGAIRKAYIALLCELNDRKMLQLAQHLTNRDYLSAVKQRVRLYNEMELLTRRFERHWYGSQPASNEDWEAFRSGYHQALSFV